MSLREFVKMPKFTQLGSHSVMIPTSLIYIRLHIPYVFFTIMTCPFIYPQKQMMPKIWGKI